MEADALALGGDAEPPSQVIRIGEAGFAIGGAGGNLVEGAGGDIDGSDGRSADEAIGVTGDEGGDAANAPDSTIGAPQGDAALPSNGRTR